jgi:hypothetical protein
MTVPGKDFQGGWHRQLKGRANFGNVDDSFTRGTTTTPFLIVTPALVSTVFPDSYGGFPEAAGRSPNSR